MCSCLHCVVENEASYPQSNVALDALRVHSRIAHFHYTPPSLTILRAWNDMTYSIMTSISKDSYRSQGAGDWSSNFPCHTVFRKVALSKSSPIVELWDVLWFDIISKQTTSSYLLRFLVLPAYVLFNFEALQHFQPGLQDVPEKRIRAGARSCLPDRYFIRHLPGLHLSTPHLFCKTAWETRIQNSEIWKIIAFQHFSRLLECDSGPEKRRVC